MKTSNLKCTAEMYGKYSKILNASCLSKYLDNLDHDKKRIDLLTLFPFVFSHLHMKFVANPSQINHM